MTDKVQKIREEVERLYNQSLADENRQAELGLKSAACTSYGKSKVCKELLSFIDSLQEEPSIPEIVDEHYLEMLGEEPVSIWHDGCEIPKSETNILMIRKDEKDSNYPPIAGCFHGTNSRLDGKNWGYYNGFCYNEIEPPVKWAYIDDILKLSNVERTIKNWKEEPENEDLGAEMNRYFDDMYSNCTGCERVADSFNEGIYREIARHFANWQRRQMTKDAIEATVKVDLGGYPYVDRVIELYDYDKDIPLAKEGDKYKVVLIKEE